MIRSQDLVAKEEGELHRKRDAYIPFDHSCDKPWSILYNNDVNSMGNFAQQDHMHVFLFTVDCLDFMCNRKRTYCCSSCNSLAQVSSLDG